MSAPSEAKGGKSSKMPILMVPALVMSSSASALADPAPPVSRPSAKVDPRAMPRTNEFRREVEKFMTAPLDVNVWDERDLHGANVGGTVLTRPFDAGRAVAGPQWSLIPLL